MILRQQRAQSPDCTVTKAELDEVTADIVRRGLGAVDKLLEEAAFSYDDVALCLATGGMTNMPTIRNGLTERFLGRVPNLPNGDRIIAEGAAWIAHDGVRLTLSKPVELLVADTSGFGAYHPLVNAGFILPLENETKNVENLRLFCVDPREGRAMVQVVKPVKPGRISPADDRRTIGVVGIDVDPDAMPLMERIQCVMQIDQDYVGKIILESTVQAGRSTLEFHDLEFALSLPSPQEPEPTRQDDSSSARTGGRQLKPLPSCNVTSRTNVSVLDPKANPRQVIPGDLVRQWWPSYFDVQSREPTRRQKEEEAFYCECARCGRFPTEFRAEGCEECGILPRGDMSA
jgi:molecular chaperone DnaK